MGDIQNAEAAVVSTYSKVVAWVKAHIPHSLIGTLSYIAGKIGVIGMLYGKFE